MNTNDDAGQDDSGGRQSIEYQYQETLVGPDATADIPAAAIDVQHERIGDRLNGGPRVRVSWLEPADGEVLP